MSMYHIRNQLRFSPFNIYYICVFLSVVFWTDSAGILRLYSHYCTFFLAGVRNNRIKSKHKVTVDLAWETDVVDIVSYLGRCLPKTGSFTIFYLYERIPYKQMKKWPYLY